MRYRIGVIGLGSMGRRYVPTLLESPDWELAWLCDRDAERLRLLHQQAPGARATTQADDLFNDRTLDAVGIFTLADARPALLRRALAAGKHVIAEKPLAATLAEEWQLLAEIEASDRLVTVNLFNRNAWYHHEIQQYIAQGELGELAILRLSHQTPGLMPTEGHAPEGPPFHDCGMHYVDVARWYAGSEYADWHAQGLCLWGWPEPWWVTAHGHFANGVVFEITQGFTYGQLADTKTEHCALEAIGTLGLVRLTHDFHEVTIAYHGTSSTTQRSGPYGSKQLGPLCEGLARSLAAGHSLGLPQPRDSVIASQVAQDMLDAARRAGPPMRGEPEQLARILDHRRMLRSQPKLSHPALRI